MDPGFPLRQRDCQYTISDASRTLQKDVIEAIYRRSETVTSVSFSHFTNLDVTKVARR